MYCEPALISRDTVQTLDQVFWCLKIAIHQQCTPPLKHTQG